MDTLRHNAPKASRGHHHGLAPLAKEITGRVTVPRNVDFRAQKLRPKIKTDGAQGFPFWLLSSSLLQVPRVTLTVRGHPVNFLLNT